MKTTNFFNSKSSKIVMGMFFVMSATSLLKYGFMFGQWLHQMVN